MSKYSRFKVWADQMANKIRGEEFNLTESVLSQDEGANEALADLKQKKISEDAIADAVTCIAYADHCTQALQKELEAVKAENDALKIDNKELRPALALFLEKKLGMSSETIISVMTEHRSDGAVPYDVYDFGRCHNLLKAIPSYRDRLPEVAKAHPRWTALVRDWDKLTEYYLAKNYARLNKMITDCIDPGEQAK